MNKISLILKYFQKKDQLIVEDREYQKFISTFFAWLIVNDKVDNDKTTKYFPNILCTAKIIAKDVGILSGIEEIEFLLKKFTSLSFKSLVHDGSQFKNGEVIAEIKGKSHEILGYERTVLNILQHMSGIASATNQLISLINPSHHIASITNNRDRGHLLQKINPPFIAATRKTPWMWLDKKAVAVGGGLTHRLNLSGGILIKDNHIVMIKKAFHFKTDEEAIEKAIKSIIGRGNTEAVKTPQGWPVSKNSPGVEESEKLIEIEVENFQQAHKAIKTFNKLNINNHLAILLDNFTPSAAKTLLSDLSNLYDLSAIIFEASGGITEKNIKEWAKTGVDIISLGFLTHSTHAFNLSLEIII